VVKSKFSQASNVPANGNKMSLRSDNYSWQTREDSSVALQLPIFISHFHFTYEIKARALGDLYVYLHYVCSPLWKYRQP